MWSKSREKKTFFLYNVGRSPDILCLGNIMIGGYTDPDQLAKYIHGPLSSADMQKYTTSTDLGACTISKTAGVKLGPNIDVMSLVKLGLCTGRSHERVVSASEGKRVLLKEPHAFLDEVILGNPQIRDKIILLLSASARSSGIVTGLGKVKIWMLTGYYALNDAQMTVGKSRELGMAANVDSTATAAAGGAPVGGGVEMNFNKDATTSIESKGWLVWAAQWRLLESSLNTWPGALTAGYNSILRLRMDVVSRGIMYAASPEQQYASLYLEKEEDQAETQPERKEQELELSQPVGWLDWLTGPSYPTKEHLNQLLCSDEFRVDDDIGGEHRQSIDHLEHELQYYKHELSPLAPPTLFQRLLSSFWE